jgi:hypothetical protein
MVTRGLAAVLTAALASGAAAQGNTTGRSQQWRYARSLTAPVAQAPGGHAVALQVATFNLTPRAPLSDNIEQARQMGDSVVEVVKTMLYAQTGEAAASAQGRRLWYDRNTLTLTVCDTPENLRRVSDYVRSVSTLPADRSKSEIVFLKHQSAEEMAGLIQRVTGIEAATGGGQQTGLSVTKTLRVEGELTFRDLRIRVTRINENDAADKNDDSVDLVVRTPTTSEDRTIEEFRSEFIDDYEINVIEVRPSGTPGEGSARIEIRYNPQATGAVGVGPRN